jgi:centromere/kinetochore protein ZW10
MSTDTLAPTILNYINHGTYPDNEEVASATLTSSDLSTLLTELRKAQNEAKDSIRSLSRSTAPDIDTWITRARELQAAILRSRDAAREIVKEAEAGEKLKADVDDKRNKVQLLEKEVGFNEALTGTLEHVRYANGLLQRAQEEAVHANVERALSRLEDAEASIAGLDGVNGSQAVTVLQQKAAQLREGLAETSTECWNALVHLNAEERMMTIQRQGLQTALPDAAVPAITLAAIVIGLKGLDVFDPLVQKLARDIDRAILKPRMVPDDNFQVAKMTISGSELSCSVKTSDLSTESLFKDLHDLLSYLSANLPATIAQPLSSYLIPALAGRLETHWLDAAIPLDISEMQSFQSLLDSVSALAEQIDALEWEGAQAIRDWIESAPRLWLTKRREAVLGDVRDWVFRGLRERKTVERVETRMVRREDVGLSQKEEGGDGDEWDDAWDDEESKPESSSKDAVKDEDVEEASAWDIDDDEVSDTKEESSTDGGEEDDAWGWGDEETSSQKPPSPVATRKQAPKTSEPPNGEPAEQELTLRETFTTTAIPSGIVSILQQGISDAQTLSGPDFADSLIAPAASALYTLSTLALAIYRATAPTAYAKDKDGLGGMLIYNDASWLADQLRSWKDSQPPGSKLRVDTDVTALEQFAKKAYSAEMESQRTVLRDLLDGAQGFGNCTAQPFKQECDGAVDATVDRVRTVQGMWNGILSQGALLQSLGSLLSTVTGKMITEIQDLSDISEPESQQLKALCDRVTALKSLFIQSSPQGASEGSGQDMTFIYCPNWLKFQYLAEILASSLADIRWMWKEGELSLEFGAEEVVGFVEALFAESTLRRDAVREIRGGGRR